MCPHTAPSVIDPVHMSVLLEIATCQFFFSPFEIFPRPEKKAAACTSVLPNPNENKTQSRLLSAVTQVTDNNSIDRIIAKTNPRREAIL